MILREFGKCRHPANNFDCGFGCAKIGAEGWTSARRFEKRFVRRSLGRFWGRYESATGRVENRYETARWRRRICREI